MGTKPSLPTEAKGVDVGAGDGDGVVAVIEEIAGVDEELGGYVWVGVGAEVSDGLIVIQLMLSKMVMKRNIIINRKDQLLRTPSPFFSPRLHVA